MKTNNFIKIIKPYRIAIVIALIITIISSYFYVIGPAYLKDITNIIAEGFFTNINFDKLNEIILFLIIIYLLSSILNYIEGVILNKISQKIAYELRHKVTKKIFNLPLSYYDNSLHGDLLSKITNDVDTISQSLDQGITLLLSSLIILIGSLIYMLITNIILTTMGVISSLVGFVLMVIIMKKSQKYFDNRQKTLGDLNGYIEEMYHGHSIVKVSNMQEKVIDKFHTLNNKYTENIFKSSFYSGLIRPIMSFTSNFSYVVISVTGFILVSKNIIPIGVVVAFIMYIRTFTQQFAGLAQSMQVMQSTFAASKRINEFLEEKEVEKEENKVILSINNIKGKVLFDKVTFGYDDKLVIKNFSVHIPPNAKVAIVGKTGSGKTTLVNLLMKFYPLNRGLIKIDDIDIKDISRNDIAKIFCMVLQDSWIFEGTILDNIRFNTQASDEEVIEVSKKIGLDHFINTLERGYNTYIKDSESLSSGEKQLITIARGMLKKSPILILDEATSNVDTRTEKIVQNAMEQLIHNKTAFIIAHRLSTIKNADIILVLENGNIVEMGKHEELLTKKGTYAKMYKAQFN